MRSSLAKRSLLFLLTLGLALAAAELAVRLAFGGGGDATDFSFEPITVSVQEERGRFQRHPRRFFELAPHYVHGPRHLGRYALGDWNFRNSPPEPRAPGRLRVVVLGDSCMYGVGVDPADTVPEQLARALDERGLSPAQVQVLNLGVPGYSTVQIEAMLDEALQRFAPDAVVFYPAAWNDQAPNVWKDDLQLEREAVDPGWFTRLRRSSRLVALLSDRFGRVDPEAVVASWAAGEPLLGWRVPPEETDRRLARMFGRVRDAELAGVVAAPIHPDSTQTAHPRTDRDARAVRRLGAAAGLPVVGGPLDTIEQRSPRNDRLFVDYAHHSPEGTALLAGQLAEALAPLLRADPRAGDGGLRVVSVEPPRMSVFGDDRLAVTVAGMAPGAPRPEVLVGGAPLLDVTLEPAPDGVVVRGWVMANSAGAHDVIVQAAQGTAVARAAVELVDPWLELVPGAPPRLRVHGRPGDSARAFVGVALREEPLWSHRGPFRLADGFAELGDLHVGDDGAGELPLPDNALALDAAVYVQAAVVPRGDPLGDSHAARWTPLLVVD